MKWAALALAVVATVFPRNGHSASLSDRFDRTACAVVLFTYEGGTGTGFFINSSGRLVTAAHVAYDRHWKLENSVVSYAPVPRTHVVITLRDNSSFPISVPTADDTQKKLGDFDLAIIETHIENSCYLSIGDSQSIRIGAHVVGIGYPGTSAPVLYDGILSGRYPHPEVPVTQVDGNPSINIMAKYDVLRVQMPITPGASGGPIIDDQDNAIGVISEVPLTQIGTVALAMKEFIEGSQTPKVKVEANSSPDLEPTIGALAWMMAEFESPGTGIAVPLRYLK